jgi:uncharacterized protein YcfJ
MRVVECILINDCLAPKRVGNGVSKKAFRAGARVVGTVTNIALTPDSQVLALRTKDGYEIPEPFLNILGEVKQKKNRQKSYSNVDADEVQYAEVVEERSEDKSVSSVFQSLKAADIISTNSLKSKRVVNFALGGAAIGLVYAMMKDKNKLVMSTVGAVGGGIIGNYIGRKIKENETK